MLTLCVLARSFTSLACWRRIEYSLRPISRFSSSHLISMQVRAWITAFACLAALAVALVGCAGPSAPSWWPFADVKDKVPGIKTPDERITELKALAARSASGTPDEQQRLCADLAAELQREQDPLVRMEILKALASFQNPTAAVMLRAGMADSDDEVRIACCEAWTKRGGPEAVEHLSQALGGDTSLEVRLAAARGLGASKDQKALGPLVEVLADNDPALQNCAVQSLRQISGQDFGGDIQKWRQYAAAPNQPQPPTSIAEKFRKLF